jgi:hypothetical protein
VADLDSTYIYLYLHGYLVLPRGPYVHACAQHASPAWQHGAAKWQWRDLLNRPAGSVPQLRQTSFAAIPVVMEAAPAPLQTLQEQLPALQALESVRSVTGPTPAALVPHFIVPPGSKTPVGVGVPSGTAWDWDVSSAVGPPLRPETDGPWEIEVRLDGPDRTAYSHPVRLRLTVGPDYPQTAPVVRFASIVHHFMLQKARPHEMLEQYMNAVVADEGADHSLAGTVEAVLTFLATPLHPCDHCDTNYKAVGQQNHERWQSIENYTPLRRHPRLFEPSTFLRPEDLAPPFRCGARARVPRRQPGQPKVAP